MNHKKRLVVDSSALILLTKSSLIDFVLEKNKILIPDVIYEEAVTKGMERGHQDAYQIEELKTEGKILIKNSNKLNAKFIENHFMLHRGEKEAIALAYELKIPLIIDDRKGRNAAKALQIKLTSTLGILDVLISNKKIKKEVAFKSLNVLENYGWYKKN